MYKMFENAKDPMSALTHFIGFLVAIPCFFFLVIKAQLNNSVIETVAFTVFGCSLLLLYGASTIYHTMKVSIDKSEFLRRIDHMMIFILIAGSYTPICLIALRDSGGIPMLVLIWALAVVGIIIKICWWNAPRWLSTGIYVAMGWLAVIVLVPLSDAVGISGIYVLLAGGIAYTIGAVIYGLKKPNFNFKHFGFHEIFHVFVMIGSGVHIAFMFLYL